MNPAQLQQQNEQVLKLSVPLRPEPQLSFEQAANLLGQFIRWSNTTPYYRTYIDKPAEGEIHAIFQYEKLPPFTVDGLRYLERESEYFISLGPYELCIQETKFGFVPNSGETHASRVRRKIRFSKGGVSTVMLVHYSRGPAQPIPPEFMRTPPVRQYPLIPSAEPAIFVMGEKTGQRVPLQSLQMLQQQQQQQGLIPGPQGFQPQANAGGPQPPRGPMQNPMQAQNAALASQNAAIAAQNAAMAGHRGPPKPHIPEDPNDEDESDVVTHRDISTTRFIRNHEFLAEVFSPEPTPKPVELPEEKEEDLQAALTAVQAEIDALNQRTTELEAMKLANESAALVLH
ncbi:hypothetical protein FS837_002703 [Tulasnella sp. UAMH 9824]|nr:hypothetical protein FS837_002703 [Tulasnella sp. UAMH 9824]